MANQLKFPAVTDSIGFPIWGAADGAQFYSIKPYNTFTIAAANKDGSAASYAEMGVKDNDMWQLFSLGNNYFTPSISNNPNQDITLTFAAAAKQILVDNTRNTNSVYIEYSDVAANGNSIQIPAGTKEIVGINSSKVHIYSLTPTSVVIRAWA